MGLTRFSRYHSSLVYKLYTIARPLVRTATTQRLTYIETIGSKNQLHCQLFPKRVCRNPTFTDTPAKCPATCWTVVASSSGPTGTSSSATTSRASATDPEKWFSRTGTPTKEPGRLVSIMAKEPSGETQWQCCLGCHHLGATSWKVLYSNEWYSLNRVGLMKLDIAQTACSFRGCNVAVVHGVRVLAFQAAVPGSNLCGPAQFSKTTSINRILLAGRETWPRSVWMDQRVSLNWQKQPRDGTK